MRKTSPFTKNRCSHTPLFATLRRIMRLASLANQPHAAPVDELLEMHAAQRRAFLKAGVGAAGVWVTAGLMSSAGLTACSNPRRDGPRVVIVGAGIAGLNAAYVLKKAGVRADVYEASSRSGGRMLSARDLLAPGLVTELGGEFIDSSHVDILTLAQEFGLTLLDRQADSEANLRTAYFFGGRHYSERQVVEAFRPLATRISKDAATLGEVIDYKNPGNAVALDKLSVGAYLDKIGAHGWVRQFLKVAYITEYGLDEGEQSALNLITMISTDVSAGKIQVFGDSDERYKISGGNASITEHLTQRLGGQVQFGYRLEALHRRATGYTLSFQTPNQSVRDVHADYVLLTLPFSVLREVRIMLDLPHYKTQAIQELGYGTNAKILVGTTQRLWRKLTYSGEVFSDQPFQFAWDNSQGQAGVAGGLTLFSGGKAGVEVGHDTPEHQANRLMAGMERVFPGVRATLTSKVARHHWPSAPYSKGSYACYRPGQWTTIAGAEFEPVGNLYFAGEHCSTDFQGFMNGGAETGRRAAQALLAVVGKTRVATAYDISRRELGSSD